MLTAYVICKNDEVKFVVIGSLSKAVERMDKFSKEDYKKLQYTLAATKNYDDYRALHRWRIQEVEAEIGILEIHTSQR